MKRLTFNCTLLSDIVLNQKAATEGNQECLDFIPGNNFLGIAAKKYATLSKEESLNWFHTGAIKFGDAHPIKNEKRCLRIPASMYYSKLGEDSRVLIHHQITDSTALSIFQPKQFRSGFYDLLSSSENSVLSDLEVKVEKSFAIKSAYDRDKRRSEDEKMYGYQSLCEGSKWQFSVFIENDIIKREDIINALEGTHRIGRSRSAQYGVVEIKFLNTKEEQESPIKALIEEKKPYLLIYADARLIFIDEYGLPSFQPTAEQLGVTGGAIDWEKSQIRTFQYAPWNFKRQARDADRCGIEKGSVFYIKQADQTKELTHDGKMVIGGYQNEGFGNVMVNPPFLKAKENANGESRFYTNRKQAHTNRTQFSEPTNKLENNALFKFLAFKEQEDIGKKRVYEVVNAFVNANGNKFGGNTFASQWGTIRSIAMQEPNLEERKKDIEDYVTHGVAKDKWGEKGRFDSLNRFLEDTALLENKHAQSAIINLAAEMAKKNK